MTASPLPFDPYYSQDIKPAADKTVAQTTITATRPVVLVQAGATAAASAIGYQPVSVAATGDLLVYGDIVRIEGALSLPQRAVQIVARILEVRPAADGTQPSIDVSGPPGAKPPIPLAKLARAQDGSDGKYTYVWAGKDPYTDGSAGTSGAAGAAGAAGDPGKDAGWIDLRCGQLDADATVTSFKLSARGGDGGNGQDGQPGQDGGNGGRGADAQHYPINNDTATDGKNAGAGGPGGPGGPAGHGGSGGVVNVICAGALPVDLAIDTALGASGTAGQDAGDGKDGTPGKGGAGTSWSNDGYTTYTLPGGHDGGIAARNAASPANAAAPGTPTPGPITQTPSAAFPAMIAPVVKELGGEAALGAQLEMLLDNIRMDTLTLNPNSTDGLGTLSARLDWLFGVANAPCADAEAAGQTCADLSWANLAGEAAARKKNLMNPALDAFGNIRTWAPIASLSAYDSQLGDTQGSLDVLKTAEAQWQAYVAAQNAARTAKALDDAQINDAQGRLAAIKAQMDADRTALIGLVADITNMVTDVENAKDAVTAAEDKFKKALDATFNFDFDAFLSVIEQVSFVAGDPAAAGAMGTAEVTKFFKTSLTQIKGLDGQTYDKSYVTSQVTTLKDKLGNLDEAYETINGYIQAGDSDGCKLLASQDDLNQLLANYPAVDGAQDAQDAMTDYVAKVTKRNGLITQYNSALSDFTALSVQFDQLTERLGQLSAKDAQITLSTQDRFQQGLYQHAKQQVIDDLYGASRAYRFWSLSDMDVFTGLPDITYLAAAEKRQDILSGRLANLNKLKDDVSPQTDPVMVTFDGKHLAAIIKAFKTDRGKDTLGTPRPRYWEFKLTPWLPGMTQAQSPFHGMTNVRLDEVRCWLLGLQASDGSGNVTVHVTQRGDEQIVPRDASLPVYIDHDPIDKIFKYKLAGPIPSDTAVETHTAYWIASADGVLPSHTPIGPFATWRIALDLHTDFKTDNTGEIAWDSLTGILMQFYVRSTPAPTAHVEADMPQVAADDNIAPPLKAAQAEEIAAD